MAAKLAGPGSILSFFNGMALSGLRRQWLICMSGLFAVQKVGSRSCGGLGRFQCLRCPHTKPDAGGGLHVPQEKGPEREARGRFGGSA